MKIRTKVFLSVLLLVCAVAAVIGKEPRILIYCLAIYVGVWCVWRCFLFLYILLTPIRKKIQPINNHIESSLRSAGLNQLASTHENMRNKIDETVSTSVKDLQKNQK